MIGLLMHAHAQHLAMLCIACCALHSVLLMEPSHVHTLYNGRAYAAMLVLPEAMPTQPGWLHTHSGHNILFIQTFVSDNIDRRSMCMALITSAYSPECLNALCGTLWMWALELTALSNQFPWRLQTPMHTQVMT